MQTEKGGAGAGVQEEGAGAESIELFTEVQAFSPSYDLAPPLFRQ
jgi:hypothetical protein